MTAALASLETVTMITDSSYVVRRERYALSALLAVATGLPKQEPCLWTECGRETSTNLARSAQEVKAFTSTRVVSNCAVNYESSRAIITNV